MALPSETVSLAGSGLVFVNTYSAAVTNAYRGAVITAENYLQSHFTDAVTITADFDMSALGAHSAASNSFFTIRTNYTSLVNALRAHATTADDVTAVNGLPTLDPSGGLGWAIATPEARVLGLTSLTNAQDITLTGGAGADTFHTFAGAGTSVVTDFHAWEGDRVQLDPGNSWTVSQQGADVVIDVNGGGEMVLQNVQLSSLQDGWIFT